jgi:predicted MFS family arabinose efflux permease
LLLNVDPALPFYLPVAIALIAFSAALLFLPESRAASPETVGWKGLARTFVPTPLLVFFASHDNRTRLYLYLFLHVFAAFAALEGMFPLYAAERFGWDERQVGLFLSLIAISFAFTQVVLVARLSPVLGEVTLSAIGLGLCSLGLLGLGETHTVWMMVLAALFTAVGTGLWFPTFTSLFSKACGSADEAGEFMARSVAMSQTGRGLGIILGGLAHQRIGPGAEFTLGGIGVALALVILLVGLPMLAPRR